MPQEPLPEAVRQRVVEAAAEVLGSLKPDEVPVPLRQIARFRPQSRARQGAMPIAAQLEQNAEFRERVAKPFRESQPELVAALEAGSAPAAADPVLTAALAYLLRPEGWTTFIDTARAELESALSAAQDAEVARKVSMLKEQLEAAKAARSEELDRARSELKEARGEIADLRRKLFEEKKRAKDAVERAEKAVQEHEQNRTQTVSAQVSSDKELRALRGRLAHAESALESSRKAAREGRSLEDVRLRLLLDTLVDAAQGVRRELNLPTVIARPADVVGGEQQPMMTGRSLSDNDPQLLNQLLALPQVHLIVDGYNVTKTGYADLPLAAQRTRLVGDLAALASARPDLEITIAFDGAAEPPVAVRAPRGVRVLFSAAAEIADALIARLVEAEPVGRTVVVVSSDGEVAAHARSRGARAAASQLLLDRLAQLR